MFSGSEHIKKLNMKVAGTLPKNKDKQKPSNNKDAGDNEKVWEVNMEGLTSKQKKNLRKKLQR